MRKNVPLILVYSLAILVLFLVIIRQIIFVFSGEMRIEPYLTASILISIATVTIRLFLIDSEKFSSVIFESDMHKSQLALNPRRFLNLMPVAMIICTVADFLITLDFIVGTLTFLVAHTLYIISYSGIVHLHPKVLFIGKTKTLALGSTLAWIIIPTSLYLLLIFNPTDIMTLIVIPYVVVLCLMCLITYFAVGYSGRSKTFRIMLAGGATWFFISDAILAIGRFNSSITIPMEALVIGATYLLAVFMLQYASLFLRSPEGDSIMRTNS